MENTNGILNELNSWDSPLARISREMPYVVPAFYFNEFAGRLLEIIALEDEADPVVAFPKTMPYELPTGYFNGSMAAYSMLSSSGDLIEKRPDDISTKAIRLKHNTILRSLKWAAAAMLVVGIGLGSYRSFMQHPSYDTEKALATVPKSEINDYVQQNIDDYDVDMIVTALGANGVALQPKQLNNNDIIDYLNENGWQDTQ